MRIQAILHRTTIALRHPENEHSDQHEQSCNRLWHPKRFEFAKQGVEAQPNADRRQASAHPSCKGPLVGHDGAVFRPFGAIFGELGTLACQRIVGRFFFDDDIPIAFRGSALLGPEASPIVDFDDYRGSPPAMVETGSRELWGLDSPR